ncbi:MAG: CapA family protein [Candidatus Cloacimonadaceae bacterium]|jgi:poly-gamma-glutamate capsule biosynthesis protein CapA/YwtB (metallophosphatase superfamily)|nr:CapA family protein [Candidatus Cloacimonadota bacterium]MDY0128513.1 CapA family protein [Candidatus Cloacimonadaceae bacterium]MCB5254841.1 CapA family protein [Candidatus Cloacimonadota bacterium]MCK9179152.1 CapA family protein [Candidatus Cloacimonadota bacterium]MCK9243427.1 CapA family protein [Candidatus Cloacimonadota bacterium]
MRHIVFTTLLVFSVFGLFAQMRPIVIEDFDDGQVTLTSWADEDLEPDAWYLDNTNTHASSAYSLCLSGNTWKEQSISPTSINSNTVISMAAYYQSGSKVQGIGFSDGVNQLFYSISGSLILNLEVWVPVYQGAYSSYNWHEYQLPVGKDWESFFGYYPTLSSLIYVSDLDGISSRSVWFDSILNITGDLPIAPQVSISATSPLWLNQREVSLQFEAIITDPDSDTFSYYWSFGDGQTSTQAAPLHIYEVTDAHQYTATLRLTDDCGMVGLASTQVNIDQGPSSLPLTMNFVGDVMLARRYESHIIPYYGINSIFAPTFSILGGAADITSANLEVILANTGSPHPTKSVVYRGNPDNVSALVFAGIDIVSLANNHTLDYGLPALQQTQDLLDANGILHSGAGANSYEAYLPAFINRKGLSIAFLRSSDRTGQYNNAQPYLHAGFAKEGFAYMTPYYIGEQINAVENVADLKIVELHAGSEYSLQPGADYGKSNPYQGDTQDEDYYYRSDIPHQWDRQIRHTAVDSGADLVVVHHPHIIQGLELYNGKVIAHSLGNFAFDLDYPECMNSMILYVDAYEDGFRNHHVKPVYINGYIPKPATGQLGIYILDYIAMKSRELDTVVVVDKQELSAWVPLDPDGLARQESVLEINTSFESHEDGYQISKPIKLPRYGSISSVDELQPAQDAQMRMGSELIWYGNFEAEGSSLWQVPEFSDNAVDGERSAFLSANPDESTTAKISKKLKLYDNEKKYTLHGWMRSRNAGAANIIIRFYSSRNSYYPVTSYSVSEDLTGTNSWAWHYAELSLPDNAWYFDIQLSLEGASAGISQAWFDNVGLIEWTPYSPASELSEVMHPNNYYWFQMRTAEAVKSLTCRLTETDFMQQTPRLKNRLLQAQIPVNIYPNPFNPDTTIDFDLPQSSRTSLKIYNVKGQLLRTLVDEMLSTGHHRYRWDGKDQRGKKVSSGLHFIKIQCGNKSATRKAVLLK